MMYSRELGLYRFLLQYSRGLTRDLDPDQYVLQPHTGMNHPAWILGHLTYVAQFGVSLCGGEGWLDDAWTKRFGVGSEPTSELSRYPSSVELFASYEDGHARLNAAVETVDPARLEAPTTVAALKPFLPTHGQLLGHILTTHEATHLGQLSAWRRCVGLPGVAF